MLPEELLEVVSFACELRQRVHNQLCKIAPGEFKERMIAPASVAKHVAKDMGRT
jgi:ATP-dependent Lon protease